MCPSVSAATVPNFSVKNGLLTPDRGYPLISDPAPLVQTKTGPLAPLSDVWKDPLNRGTADISVEAITTPNVAGIGWKGSNVFLKDLVRDNNAVRNASFGDTLFTTTLKGNYTELAFLNVVGSINAPDSWVTGALKGIFGGAADPNTLEILFGFDGFNRGREDFITAFINGKEVNNFGSLSSLSGDDSTFRASGTLFSNALFPLEVGDQVTIEGTFSCVAYNGQCGADVSFKAEEVPEPLTILGSVAALGFGATLKRKSRKRTHAAST